MSGCTGACHSGGGCTCTTVGRVTFGPYTPEDRSPLRDEPCRYKDANVRTMVHILVEETPLGDVLLRKGYHFEADAKKACEQRQTECDAASALRGMVAPRFFVETIELEVGQ